jgi:4'-phosphopantetheinyl transferase
MAPLDDATIDLWFLNLAATDDASRLYWDFLDEEERSRAERFRSPKAQNNFVRTRGHLRFLLGQYLNENPRRFGFIANDHGKPRLRDSREDRGVVFNISHSGDVAVLAFSLDAALGVDIELPRPHRDLEGLANMCLAPAELAWWRRYPPDQRLTGFTRLWVCKEAFVKAVGRGIGLGLTKVNVSRDFTGFESLPEEYGAAAEWRLHEWAHGDCRMAVAFKGRERAIRIFE